MAQSTGSKGRIAWSIFPTTSGVATVYRVVGDGLRRAGWDVLGVTSGADGYCESDHPRADESVEVLLPHCVDVKRAATALVDWVESRNVDVIFCTGLASTLAAGPALPARVRLINRCASMTHHAYRLATANLGRADKIIAETPREEKDLVRQWGVPPEKCVVIPGGVEIEKFTSVADRQFSNELRLIYLGRLDDASKGVMLLGPILKMLVRAGISFHLDVVGNGPDEDRLRKSLLNPCFSDRVALHGPVPRQEIPSLLRRAHVLLLPSRFEGVPWALLEGMACGCVPVASRISGATDFVVRDEVNGLLCTVGSAAEFARAVVDLATHRDRLQLMSSAAIQAIRDRFTVARVVRDHDELLQTLLAQKPPAYKPIPLSQIRAPELPVPKWRRWVPQELKNCVRTWAERFQRSV